jgi:hypothetical protein
VPAPDNRDSCPGRDLDARPSLAETAACGILREHRFSLRREPAIFGLQPPDWKLADLREPMLLGETPLSAQDRAHAEAIACYGIGARWLLARQRERGCRGRMALGA